MVCTDSTIALNAFYGGLRCHSPHMVPDFDVDSLLSSSVCIKLVSNDINDLVDQLVVNGLRREDLFQ